MIILEIEKNGPYLKEYKDDEEEEEEEEEYFN